MFGLTGRETASAIAAGTALVIAGFAVLHGMCWLIVFASV